MLGLISDATDPFVIWELCCSWIQPWLKHVWSASCKLNPLRKNYEAGYDMEKKEIVDLLWKDYVKERPRKFWWSLNLRCTEWCNIQNLNQRNDEQKDALRKKGQKGKRQVRHALSFVEATLQDDPTVHHYWEWPKTAYAGEFRLCWGTLPVAQCTGLRSTGVAFRWSHQTESTSTNLGW